MAPVGVAQAATIFVTDTDIRVDCDGSAAQECRGFVGGNLVLSTRGQPRVVGGSPAGLSDTAANIYSIGSNSPENEAQALDFLIDGVDNDEFVTGNQVDTRGVASLSFQTSAQYLAIKVGLGHFFLELAGPGPINLFYTADGNNDSRAQSGGGFSHYTEFGQLSAVPVPAAGLLLVSALGGMGFAARRRRRNG